MPVANQKKRTLLRTEVVVLKNKIGKKSEELKAWINERIIYLDYRKASPIIITVTIYQVLYKIKYFSLKQKYKVRLTLIEKC
jgi:hypothetical protein